MVPCERSGQRTKQSGNVRRTMNDAVIHAQATSQPLLMSCDFLPQRGIAEVHLVTKYRALIIRPPPQRPIPPPPPSTSCSFSLLHPLIQPPSITSTKTTNSLVSLTFGMDATPWAVACHRTTIQRGLRPMPLTSKLRQIATSSGMSARFSSWVRTLPFILQNLG